MYKTEPMMTQDEIWQFINAMYECALTQDVEGMKKLEAPVFKKMKAAGYKNFPSFRDACVRGEEW